MRQKIIAFDLDEVICFRPSGYDHLGPLKYDYCQPNLDVVDLLNEFYDDGHKIVIYTARGMEYFKGDVSQIYSELYQKTYKQLEKWGVKFHQLVMGKIQYDVLVDDKVLNSSDLRKETVEKFL